jgi:hypothetical protein
MSEPAEHTRATSALAILSGHEQALLAANRAFCLVCGADTQAALLACLETMDACIDLHGFPGIPCTLDERAPGADVTRGA